MNDTALPRCHLRGCSCPAERQLVLQERDYATTTARRMQMLWLCDRCYRVLSDMRPVTEPRSRTRYETTYWMKE